MMLLDIGIQDDNNNFDPDLVQKNNNLDEISLDSFQLISKEDDILAQKNN